MLYDLYGIFLILSLLKIFMSYPEVKLKCLAWTINK